MLELDPRKRITVNDALLHPFFYSLWFILFMKKYLNSLTKLLLKIVKIIIIIIKPFRNRCRIQRRFRKRKGFSRQAFKEIRPNTESFRARKYWFKLAISLRSWSKIKFLNKLKNKEAKTTLIKFILNSWKDRRLQKIEQICLTWRVLWGINKR